eukprot:NODE_4374_length_1900_cov_4.886633.p1 GENE.NODE_4374_length_1900_cov_4.886633~~NODE_4374_length_1900_cov_4.886633.p1  ORF type:complete len:255 (+),score=32.33 NODE_4374_length_1900_cov_4.886633:481-1245(+)
MPGGKYFVLFAEVSVFNACARVVRSGIIRIINLRALELHQPAEERGHLFDVLFGVSMVLFWLSDVHVTHEQPDVGEGMRVLSAVSFVLFSIGHIVLGYASNLRTMQISAVFFGIAQACATGMSTSRKDDMRSLLTARGHVEPDIRRAMRMSAAVGTVANILSSLAVGVIDDYCGGMRWVCFFYAGVACVGFFSACRYTSDLRTIVSGTLRQPLIPGEKFFSSGTNPHVMAWQPAASLEDADNHCEHEEHIMIKD